MPAINALFVDDDDTVHMIATSLLPRSGIKVLSASNTVQADTILHRERVDVIILDILMPKEDGLAYSLRLRKEGNQVPVMFLSALSDPQTVSRGLASGALEFMVKPIDLQDLELRVRKLLNRPAERQPVPAQKKTGWLSQIWPSVK
jgi:DNA-binding response OmpR family regulator